MLDRYRVEPALLRHPPPSHRPCAGPVEGSAFFRGLLIALPAGLALWALLIWVVARLLF